MRKSPVICFAFSVLLLLVSSGLHAKVKGGKSLGKGTEHSFEIIGFSKDERSVAFVQFTQQEDMSAYEIDGEELAGCEGYPKLDGKPFFGTQHVRIYRAKQPMVTVAILDGTGAKGKKNKNGCTPPSVAQQRWQRAKSKMKQYRIDKSLNGSIVRGENFIMRPAGAAEVNVRVNQWGREKQKNDGNITFSGTVAVRQNDTVVLRRNVKEKYFPVMGTTMRLGVGPHFISPSQRTLVVLVNEKMEGGRGISVEPWLFGMFVLENDVLVSR